MEPGGRIGGPVCGPRPRSPMSRPLPIRLLVGIGRMLRGLLRGSDRAAGGVASIAATIGQIALICLGVHLAADQLDDRVMGWLGASQAFLDEKLGEALGSAAESVGMGFDAFTVWNKVPLVAASAWTALVFELAACGILCAAFLLTTRKPKLTWSHYRKALSVHAVVLPFTLAGVLFAGGWSMAAEDLLPASPITPWAAGGVGLAVLLRFGLPAWGRAVGALQSSGKARRDLLTALVILPIGLLAWIHGVPFWGWLP